MKKILRSLLVVIVMAGLFTACQSYDDISLMLGADVGEAEVIVNQDTYGHFRENGKRYMEFVFADDTFENTIKEDNTWHPLPVVEEGLTALLYGLETESETYGPYLFQDLPQIENGYYFFYDHHPESRNPFDSSHVLERGELHITAAVYDADVHTLYYGEMDA
ncbi:MAG: hypothetical protein Q4C06_06440 [Bacillota bacterium]|nr:hypothetical protein [Bacillota bacterium]